MEFKYKQEYSEDSRTSEGKSVIEKYPDRVPVIVEKGSKAKIGNLDKRKFLLPGELTIGNFRSLVRKRIQPQLRQEDQLFLFIDKNVLRNQDVLANLYKKHVEQDHFLYIWYNDEGTVSS